MTAFNDLEKCNYFPLDCGSLVAIGWLSAQSEYTKGEVSKEFFEKLTQMAKDPWQPLVSAGIYHCELCQFNAPGFTNNVFIPFKGKIFVCPEAIVHYIAAHWYKPPQVFIEAVMNCPEMRSMEYKKAILSNGGRELIKIKV